MSTRMGAPSAVSPVSRTTSSGTPSLLSPTSTIHDPSGSRFRPSPTNRGYSNLSRIDPSRKSTGISTISSSTMRKDSSASASGTSTPDYAKRARRIAAKGGGNADTASGDKDWAGMEPDEIFKKLPVVEVKKVEAKMRADAFHKQAELRSMVGTRYRDLLTSATQITTLHSSSLRLSENLKRFAKQSQNPNDVSIAVDEDSQADEAEVVMNMLPVASHMKLLLDAPEALYGYLSHHAYLNAAYLWLVARVVKENLSNMEEKVSSIYLPLLQKQWETLQPFRSQISQRATAALRSREKLDTRALAETLLAVILLDNLPLPEAITLLLSQRTKAVQDILSHSVDLSEGSTSNTKTSKTHLSAGDTTRRRAGSTATRSLHEREHINKVLTEAVECLLDTVNLTQGVFGPNERKSSGNGPDGESLIEEMVRLVQVGEPIQNNKNDNAQSATPQPTMTRRTSHERRASRIFSLSLPITPTTGITGPPVSTVKIIQTLPSSSILLRHLPTSVLGFTPFIAPSKLSDLSDRLASWANDSINTLTGSLPSWLADVRSVQDVWHVRNSVYRVLERGDLQNQIKTAMEESWSSRVREVWSDRLSEILKAAEASIRDTAETFRSNPDELDIDAETYMFSEISFPSAPSSILNSTNSTSFHSFLTNIKRRGTLRTPKLDSVLSELEKSAQNLKADIAGLPESLYTDYAKRVEVYFGDLTIMLDRVLDSMGSSRGDGKDGISAELFIGRVALHLAKTSDCLANVVGPSNASLDQVQAALLQVHAKSTNSWQDNAIETAITKLAPIFAPFRGPNEVQASWQGSQPVAPSHAIMASLSSLVASQKQLGIPPGVKLSTVQHLVEAFVDKVSDLEGWKEQEREKAVQAAVDLGFLNLIKNGKVVDTQIQKVLETAGEACPPNFSSSLSGLLHEHLRRTQLLIYPLIAHLDPTILGPPSTPAMDARSTAALLSFGPPSKGSAATEFRSPIAVAKPGKRFGLLSIAA